MISIILSSLAFVVSLINLWFCLKVVKSITTIIGPKLDEQDNRYTDLIKKLKKIL